MKNILYLSYDGMTDPLGQSQVLPYLIGLSKEGYRFTLISFEKPERLEKDRSIIQQRCNLHGIDWHPLVYTKHPPVLSTVYDLIKLKRLAFRLNRKRNFAIVHCRSYLTAMIGLSLQKKGAKMLFDMRGFWADERIEGGIWNKNNPIFKQIYSFFKKKERIYFSQSDAIVSLTHAGKKEILSWHLPQVQEDKITVIPCCVDLNLFNPENIDAQTHEKKRKQFQLQSHFVVGYVGSIGTWYQLKEMLVAFKEIRKEKERALFLFVTHEKPSTIWKEAEKVGIPRDSVQIVSANHHEVPLYISLFDCAIFFIRPSFSKTASSPTKQGEIMAMGIPLICNAGVGDTDQVVKQYQAGQVVENTQRETLSSFRLDFSGFDKTKSQTGAKAFYGLENGVANYNAIYRQLTRIKQEQD